MLMPRWFWDLNPTILCVLDSDFIKYSMDLVGLGHINIINTESFVYGEDVYVVHSNEFWNCMGLHEAKIIKRKFREKLGLNKIQPAKYHFRNKESGARHFTNFDEIIELANKRTSKEWTLLTTPYTERDKFAKEFAASLIVVISCGSLGFNCIYMRDGTGLVSVSADQVDAPQFTFCYYTNIWNIGVLNHNMAHYGGPGRANVEKVLENIDRMIYTVENQRYPSGIDLFQPMSINDSKKMYHEFGEHKFIGPETIGNKRLSEYFQNHKN